MLDGPIAWAPPTLDPKTPLRAALSDEGWLEAHAAILARHDLSAEGLSLFPTGSDIVAGSAAHAVKLTTPRWAAELAVEERWLEHVAGRLSVATPTPVARGSLAGWPYLVSTRVPGRGFGEVWPSLSRDERLALARALGALTAEVHALPLPAGDHGWTAFLAEQLTSAPRRHREDGVPEALAAQIPAFLERAARSERGLVCLHTELLGDHVLVEQRGGAWVPSAMIDWADSRVGHPGYDLPAIAEFVFKGEPGCLGAFMDALGWSATPDEVMVWGLVHRFGRLRRMLGAAGGETPATLEELAARVYRR